MSKNQTRTYRWCSPAGIGKPSVRLSMLKKSIAHPIGRWWPMLVAVATGNSKRLTSTRQSVDSRPDGRSLRVDLVCYSWAIPVTGGIASRNPSPSSPSQCAASQVAETGGGRQSPSLGCRAPPPSTQSADALKILRPETVIRWHRAGFRAYWCWKSRRHGRPKDAEGGADGIDGGAWSGPAPAAAVLFGLDFA